MFPLLLALPTLIEGAGKVLDLIDHPSAKTASAALATVTTAISAKEITPAQLDGANAQLQAIVQAQSAEQADTAETQRTELASDDVYVRRMRPTWGYAMAFSWTLQMVAVSGLLFFNPAMAIQVIGVLGQLTGLWGLALGVLGIYTYGRTQEKRAAMTGDASAIQSAPAAIGSMLGATWESLTAKVTRK